MSEGLIEPGKKLYKPLLHPVTGNVLLPAGTTLTASYIERLVRQGLDKFLEECLESPESEAAGAPTVAPRMDLDSFEIDIPDLPDLMATFGLASLTPPPEASAPKSPGGSPPPGGLPVPGAPISLAPTERAVRYFHNPQHTLPERSVLGAMLASDNVESQVREGRLPGYDSVSAMIQELVDRLGSNTQNLANGIEVRIVNQPHHRCHPVNVCILSVAIGLALGYDQAQLKTLAVAALCHDIGKTAIPFEVLDKVGPLTPQEVDLLRAHTLMGKRIMEKLPWGSPLLATIVYEHHERNDGSGYPLRLTERQIHEMSKIVAVAEVYDALISDTSYRPRYTPELAYESIRGGERIGLDARVIRAFQRFIVPYPLQSYVVLDTGEIAQVVQINRQSIFRPILKVGHYTLDLLQRPDRSIVNSHYQAY